MVEWEFRLDLRRTFERKIDARFAAVPEVYYTHMGTANGLSYFRGDKVAPEENLKRLSLGTGRLRLSISLSNV